VFTMSWNPNLTTGEIIAIAVLLLITVAFMALVSAINNAPNFRSDEPDQKTKTNMNSPAQYLKSQITTMADVAAAFGRDGFSTIDVLVPEDRCAVVVAITGAHNVEQFL